MGCTAGVIDLPPKTLRLPEISRNFVSHSSIPSPEKGWHFREVIMSWFRTNISAPVCTTIARADSSVVEGGLPLNSATPVISTGFYTGLKAVKNLINLCLPGSSPITGAYCSVSLPPKHKTTIEDQESVAAPVASPGLPDHFSKQAVEYAKNRPRYPKALFDFLASVSPSLDCAWDCATGNGQAAVSLANQFKEVIATDLSREQISEAIPHPRVSYKVATSENSEIGSTTIDLTIVAQAFHWFQIDQFVQELRRVSRPEAVIAVWCYGGQSIELGIDQIVRRYARNIVGPYWPSEVKWVQERYRTIPFPFEEIPAPAFQMTQEWTLNQMIGYLLSWSATQRYKETRGTDPISLVYDELRSLWRDEEQKKKVTWDLYLRVGRVR